MTRPRFHCAEPSAIAPGRSSTGTRSGIIAWYAGKPIAAAHLQRAMRAWVTALPRLDGPERGADGCLLPFPRELVFPYAFRHSFAQRHADAGTPVDTLKELLGHDTVRTTLGYYRVTAKRKRDAQDHEQERWQIDRHQRPPVDLERRQPGDQA